LIIVRAEGGTSVEDLGRIGTTARQGGLNGCVQRVSNFFTAQIVVRTRYSTFQIDNDMWLG
jgi:hypothetical protein